MEILFNEKLGAGRFGCSEEHFENYIRQKPLTVFDESEKFYYVRDGSKLEENWWGVAKSDCIGYRVAETMGSEGERTSNPKFH